MKKNYYAVRVGRKPGIYKTWDECREQVEGFGSASYKGFAELKEAEEFLGSGNVAEGKRPGSLNDKERSERSSDKHEDESEDLKKPAPRSKKRKSDEELDAEREKIVEEFGISAFVDGSFDIVTGRFSYGCVMLLDDGMVTFSKAFDDEELSSMRNVAGEIFGSMAAMEYCMDHGIGAVTIFHDYEGIAAWCMRRWKTNKQGTADYVRFYDKASEKVEITFKKVRGHSGDTFNDLADKLAKQALGIE